MKNDYRVKHTEQNIIKGLLERSTVINHSYMQVKSLQLTLKTDDVQLSIGKIIAVSI